MLSKQLIVMHEGKYYAIEASVVATGDASDVKKEMDELVNVQLTTLPTHEEYSCAMFARFEERRFFLIYAPPKLRPVLWKNKATNEQRRFIVWMPHFYIGLFFRKGAVESGYAMVSKKKITSPEDRLSMLPLPNTAWPYGHVCEGQAGKWVITADPSETAMKYMHYFLAESEFISDINQHWKAVPKVLWPPGWDLSKKISEENCEDLNQQILSMWESLSENNRDALKNADWIQQFSVREFVSNIWANTVGPENFEIVQNAVLGGVVGAVMNAPVPLQAQQ